MSEDVRFALGIKSDPIEYRYSFDWLFAYMEKRGVSLLQLGSFFELYHLPDAFFLDLRRRASDAGVRIKSCFTAHRELGGFFTGNRHLESVARRSFERYIEIGALVGADYVGSNPGAVYRDMLDHKAAGIACYLDHMVELSRYACECGLSGLTMEPMSSLAEPPTTPEEIEMMVSGARRGYHADPSSHVPTYVCGDVSHGLARSDRSIAIDHETLFAHAIRWMVEFHFKNTDAAYHSTFGFGPADQKRGIVDLARIRTIIDSSRDSWPVDEVVGYLETGGPKLGRDYADSMLESMLDSSIDAIRAVFPAI